ncbi:MAG TPA: quaternary ammonium compound efflux SMR transporter SugE [Alphaproteobacteria bacterium]|nr:quaternary ammonium compound-resistance protein SugE [Rhodospirillaceae bacterium]HRI76071.1 quaternary ammonium compound efflux SMR transporter SugE [Alphaproteobacteria bacterium]HRJ65496.1 quaternary ammonium compound efflux SMR transporter SugE [Alphaproteobacteria bacterium]
MAWIYLFFAGLFEIAWAIGLKYSESFTRPVPSIITVICLAISMVLLGLAVRTLPIGTAYAIWTGIGAAGAVAAGIFLFHEPATAARIFFASLIVVGIVGLKLSSPAT